MAQPVVSAERTEKRLLVRVLGSLRAEQATELAQNGGSLLFVELLKWRRTQETHHLL